MSLRTLQIRKIKKVSTLTKRCEFKQVMALKGLKNKDQKRKDRI